MHVDPPFGPIYEFNDVSFDDPWGSIGIPSPFPALYGSNIPGPDAQFVTPVSVYYMQRDLQIPQLITWNLTFERQLGREWVVRAAYVGNKGTHISGSDDYNPAQEVNPAIYVPGSSTVGNTQDRRRFPGFQQRQRGWLEQQHQVSFRPANGPESFQHELLDPGQLHLGQVAG